MGVTSFAGQVWGGNNGFHRALLAHWRAALGPRDYLHRFDRSFEHGYNHVNLDAESAEDIREYSDCIRGLAAMPDKDLGAVIPYEAHWVRAMLGDLMTMIGEGLENAP